MKLGGNGALVRLSKPAGSKIQIFASKGLKWGQIGLNMGSFLGALI